MTRAVLFLTFLPLLGAQVCVSDYDCSPPERCTQSNGRSKICAKQLTTESYIMPPSRLDRYPLVECFIDSDCQPNQVCVVSQSGDRTCSSRAQDLNCYSDKDCGPRGSCTRQSNGSMKCQMAVGGGATPLSPQGGSCRRDSDCQAELQCVSRNGVLSCLLVSGNSVAPSPNSCESTVDCPLDETCVYSVAVGRLVCMNMAGPVVGGQVTSPAPQVGNIGFNRAYEERPPGKESVASFESVQFSRDSDSVLLEPNSTMVPTYDVIKKPMDMPHSSIIDPAALPCEFDYQCRMGEACTGYVHLVDRNVTVCQYDVTKQNRTCIYHSDCLHGQRCEEAKKGELFVCRTSLLASLADTACFFDYECSGGEKCVNVGAGATKEFRCRAPKFADPRRNQHCSTNGECPFQQVCRHVADVSLCVDVGSSVSSAGSHEIQKKIVDFVQNLLFARV